MKRTKAEIMEGVESIESKIVASNTVRYIRSNGVAVIRLHRTDILEFPKRGGVIFNSGGWKTKVTKDRMNDFQHEATIIQDKGLWYISNSSWDKESWDPFFDGIKIKEGKIVNAKKSNPHKKSITLQKKITAYIKKMNDMEELPAPSSGDCWFCSMFDKAGADSSNDHILSHLDEKYVHGSLIVNALLWSGYNEEQLPYIWRIKSAIVNAVRRYLKFRVGLAY